MATAANAIRLSEIANTQANAKDPYNPWATLNQSFRLNMKDTRTVTFVDPKNNDKRYSVEITSKNGNDLIDIKVLEQDGGFLKEYKDVQGQYNEQGELVSSIDSKHVKSNVVMDGDEVTVFDEFGRTEVQLATPAYVIASAKGADSTGSVKTPMPCKISQVLVTPGQKIEKGTTLIVLEAMKMEHVIKAPMTGTIGEVLYSVGDLVDENKSLVTFADEA